MRLDFESLPLVEVAAKRLLGGSLELSHGFLIALYSLVSDTYQRVEDLQQLDFPPGSNVDLVQENFLAPQGLRLINESLGVEVSIQRYAIVARWSAAFQRPYPRHEALIEALDSIVQTIEKARGVSLKFRVGNLTYVSKLPAGGDPVKPTPWPFSSEWFPQAGTQLDSPLEYQLVLSGVSGVDFRVSMHSRTVGPTGERWYSLETVAGCNFSSFPSLNEAENALHSECSRRFYQMLSQEAKSSFGLKVH